MPRAKVVPDEEVLASTAELLGARGPAGLTLAEVGRATGLAAATLVQRFGSKRGLLLAFAEWAAAGAAAPFRAARAAGGPPVEALLRALQEMAGAVAAPERMANHLGVLQLDLADAEMAAQAAAHARAVRREIAALLREAVAEGELRAADVERLAGTVQAVYNGALLLWAVDPEGSAGDRLRAEVEAVLSPWRAGEPG